MSFRSFLRIIAGWRRPVRSSLYPGFDSLTVDNDPLLAPGSRAEVEVAVLRAAWRAAFLGARNP
jgi:hypothetical protein